MRKVAILFAVAVIVPSLLLAWLAVRSLNDQQLVLERQQSLLYQSASDAAALRAADLIEICHEEFYEVFDQMAAAGTPDALAANFDDQLRARWPLAQVGFVVTLEGQILSPRANGRPESRDFLQNYSRFMANRESLEIYANQKAVAPAQVLALNSTSTNREENYNAQSSVNSSFNNLRNQQRAVMPQQQNYFQVKEMNSPSQVDNRSRLMPSETEFRQLIGEQNRGTLARYADNKLNLLVWERSSSQTGLVFGAMLSLPKVVERLKRACAVTDPTLEAEVGLALLDDSAKPVYQAPSSLQADWRRPFVASEIGEGLPHWEIGVYLLDPNRITRMAGQVKLILGLLIALLVSSIGFGGWLIVADINRQLTLARQKTDFVSNVSHELKTPLTSIRMFSELLAEGRVGDPARQKEYLTIITAETARLTRLINNVLDFAKLDRGEKNYRFQVVDLVEVAADTVDILRPHLQHAGFTLECRLPDSPVLVRADRDALSQVMVNLLSNAEKYSAERKEILVQVAPPSLNGDPALLSVLDRGLGVPKGCEERIFEKFYRAHDSLNSGISGTGLGLTLAREIALVHRGEITFKPREGGGSVFTFSLPIFKEEASNEAKDSSRRG